MKTTHFSGLLAFILTICIVQAQTIVPPGKVEGRWKLDKSPYTVQGPIYVNNGSTLFIEPGVTIYFETNDRVNIHGRLVAKGTEEQPIRFTTIDKNKGWGGIWWPRTSASNDTSKLIHCLLEYGHAQQEYPYNSGGVVGVRVFNKLLIEHCVFEYNKALHHSTMAPSGGAISLWHADIKISRCIFRYNLSAFGGAIAINDYSKPLIDNCLFYNNCVSAYGGAVEVYNHSKPSFMNCTFADNHAVYSGGAFDNCLSSCPYLLNCIIWYNTAGIDGDQVHIRSEGSNIRICHSNLEGGLAEISGYPFHGFVNEMLDAYPIFINLKDKPYALSPFSPCVETGTMDCKYFPIGWVCPCTDLANTQRVCKLQIDMGCYEYQPTLPPGEGEISKSRGMDVSVFPSPVKTTATLSYTLPETELVQLVVYDIQGRMVSNPPAIQQAAGVNQINWDAQNLPKGIYVYRLQTGTQETSGQLILVK